MGEKSYEMAGKIKTCSNVTTGNMERRPRSNGISRGPWGTSGST